MAKSLGNGFLGLLLGGFVGSLIGLFISLASIYGRADQVILGIGINTATLGLLPFLLRAV
jgi:hypothetical protein